MLVVQSEAYREEGDFDLAEKKLLKAKDLEPDEAIIDFTLELYYLKRKFRT